jgi:hypothetical protein
LSLLRCSLPSCCSRVFPCPVGLQSAAGVLSSFGVGWVSSLALSHPLSSLCSRRPRQAALRQVALRQAAADPGAGRTDEPLATAAWTTAALSWCAPHRRCGRYPSTGRRARGCAPHTHGTRRETIERARRACNGANGYTAGSASAQRGGRGRRWQRTGTGKRGHWNVQSWHWWARNALTPFVIKINEANLGRTDRGPGRGKSKTPSCIDRAKSLEHPNQSRERRLLRDGVGGRLRVKG